jgi:hypothetical protein
LQVIQVIKMPLETEEYLWRMVNEHMTQARHQETLRSSMTTVLITLAGLIVSIVAYDKASSLGDLAPALLLLLLGIFGIFFSAKHYERFNFHIARVRSYRAQLEKSFTDVPWKSLREEADAYHAKSFPRMVHHRQNQLWLVLHGVIASLGAALMLAIVLKRSGIIEWI